MIKWSNNDCLNMLNTYKIQYRYNILIDLSNSIQTWKERDWLKKNDLAYSMPSLKTTLQLLLKRPVGIEIKTHEPIICYWVSSGTWGSYQEPNIIYICPWHIENAGGLERVIRHELLHLKHHSETKDMDHDAKESFIEKRE